ncbi:hypothetical protein FXF82_00920 [Salmonella enterica subsp. enterica serovar Nigeria]|nr:hypothetical protein [Salmonella enterica subsp. enterica]EBC9934470.1 hypothetical protein [Salmonella enterica subsp. enterica serovar Nigeria]EEM8331854.1 hypothetical protein [Salmonella enterica subsp. enterica serovar Durham]EHL9702529.1 hypothetical protein [Salmonella enterica subsp. enterica serovar Infantis]ELO7938165.1 hypothetical protein [Salmonella enterica]
MATQAEVAAHLLLTDRRLRDLSKLPGAPVPQGRGEYDLDAWRQFYIHYLRNNRRDSSSSDEPEADDNSPEKNREQWLKNEERQERILMARVKRRILAKRYAPIELISVAVSRVAVELRTRVESWPPRLKKVWPEMPQEASSLLKEELAIALNELADIRVDFSDYDVSDIERDLDRVEALACNDTDDGGGMG